MLKQQNPYQIFNNYILRTPLFSLNKYLSFTSGNNIEDEKLKDFISSPEFKEAIHLASPSLLSLIKKWENSLIKDEKKENQLKTTILKYITRMSSRCTPFGLFASCCVGEFSKDTQVELQDIQEYNRLTRFDTTFLVELNKTLLSNTHLKKQLKFYPNSSLYTIAGHFRYVEQTIVNKRNVYLLEGVNHSNYLELLVQKAKQGLTINELAKFIIDDNITINDARTFIDDLIENQILVSELELTLTGQDNLTQTISILKIKKGVESITNKLISFKDALRNIDLKLGNPIKTYNDLEKELEQLNINIDKKYLFQTDLFTDYKVNKLSNDFRRTIMQVMPLLNKMTLHYKNTALEKFKKAFINRYEDNEMHLTLVLDTEIGIDYGATKSESNPLIDNLQFDNTNKRVTNIAWRDIDTILQTKLATALTKNEYFITLDAIDFKDCNENWKDLPDTMSSVIEVINENGNQKIVLNGIGGSSGANLLARFGFGNNALKKHIEEITAIEDKMNTNKVVAEIVHLPQSRTGNILQRPAFRQYEIPYLAKSSLPKQQQIPIEDIMVSIKNNSIYLRSKTLNKYIEPRLTNAHNYSYDALPIYHFLCDLQTQNKRSSIGFSWNTIFKKHSFLPRVEYKNCILAKARWLIKTEVIKGLFENVKELNKITYWRETIKLPKYVELVEGDNTLLINFENLSSISMLYNAIKNKKSFILEEFLHREEGVVKHKGDAFCNQFIVSFYNESKVNS